MLHTFRPFLLAALLGAAALPACQKATVEPESTASLVGRWELVQTSGGLAGGTRPADPTRRQELEFTANGQSRTLLNGTVTATSAYSLSQRTSTITQRTETFLHYGNSQAHSESYIEELSPTTLVLAQDAYDGMGATYRRAQVFDCGTR